LNSRFPTKKKGDPKKKKKKEAYQNVVCFECNKLGHIRSECPRAKKRFKPKKKGLMASRDDIDFE